MSATSQQRKGGEARGSSEFRIGFLVHDVSRLRQTVFDQAMKPHGVTRAQWWALAQLTRHDSAGGLTQSELARRLGLGKVAAGAMVARLEAAGLVSRRADATDLRLNRVYVTRRGQRVLDRMIAVGRALNASLTEGLAQMELEAADRVLTTLRNRLGAMLQVDAAARCR
jgi:DNA-binding MarR family transcriptional regulator